MKEFQALGLDISIIDDEGKALELKDIEEQEDKEELKLSIDEVESSPAKVVADSVIEDDDEIEEDDEDVDSEEFEAEFDSLDDIDDEIEEGEDF